MEESVLQRSRGGLSVNMLEISCKRMRNFPWELFSVLKHSDASIPSTDFLIKILKYSCSISDEYLAQKKIDRSYLSA